MAKATRHGGASFEEIPVRIRRAELGGERPSDGDNSSASTEVPVTKDDSESQSHQQPARTTDSRSSAPVKETDSDAPMTGTGGRKKAPAPSGRRVAKKATATKRTTRR